MPNQLLIARNITKDCHILLGMANRHGLITGATGTGKTVSLQTLAENFSNQGVPVFLADIKGDLVGISQAGHLSDKVKGILKERQLDEPAPQSCPTTLWDVFGKLGHPVRATVSDMGPLLLGRMLNLNDTQAGVLNLVFKIADDQGLLLLDLKDLRAMLQHVGENASQFTTEYGNVSAASVGAIQRGLLEIESQGADKFFGEPMLNIQDFLQTDAKGKGVINLLCASELMTAPRLYGTFLLWLLSELFEQLPEIGDPEKPKLVFFFDEAHLLFNEAPKVLIERMELLVRLIRSKGVGVYFVTQNPLDVPETVLGQLGNRVQHALRAFTPRDQKAVKASAQTMRPNPDLDIEKAITELGVGEALVSFLDDKGRPGITQQAYVLMPGSQLGPISTEQRKALLDNSLVAGIYEKTIDRESAYEVLKGAHSVDLEGANASDKAVAGKSISNTEGGGNALLSGLGDVLFGRTGPRGTKHDGLAQAMVRSAVRTIGSSVGREIVRGVLGGILGGRKR